MSKKVKVRKINSKSLDKRLALLERKFAEHVLQNQTDTINELKSRLKSRSLQDLTKECFEKIARNCLETGDLADNTTTLS